MKEKVDCAGRAGYYDDYGVIGDIHQNHLSEMLALATMELGLRAEDTSEDAEAESYAGMMKSYLTMQSPSMQEAVLGQYAEYQHHVEEDRSKWTKDERKSRRKL